MCSTPSQFRSRRYRVLVRVVRVRVRREDGQVAVEDDVGQRVDQRLVVDDEEHLERGETVQNKEPRFVKHLNGETQLDVSCDCLLATADRGRPEG